MDLLCPHCYRRVSVPDDRAGQRLDCPLCGQAFAAPALAAAPAAAPAPPPPARAPVAAETKPVEPKPAPRAVPRGDHARTVSVPLRADVLAWTPAVCMGLVLVLSFLAWHRSEQMGPLSLWELAFTERGEAEFLVYVLFALFLGLPFAVASLLLAQGYVPASPPLSEWLTWRPLVVAGVLAFGLLPLGLDYIEEHVALANAIALAMKLAVRLHLVALGAAVLDLWMQWRKRRDLPPPRAEVKW